jgi:hypothetical protein
MGRGSAAFTQGEIKAAVKAVADAGCEVVRVEIDKSRRKLVVVTDKSDVAEIDGSEWDEVLHGSHAA